MRAMGLLVLLPFERSFILSCSIIAAFIGLHDLRATELFMMMPTRGLPWLLRQQCLLQSNTGVAALHSGVSGSLASEGCHSAAEAAPPLLNHHAQLCGKRDARTRRGKVRAWASSR